MLEIENLSKTFGGVRALDHTSLTVRHGEIHGLVGQNGSGKSTLIKILAGFHEPDPGGRLRIAGRPVELPLPPGAFRQHGISFVHQHLGLIPSLTVIENLLIGELASQPRWRISWAKALVEARTLFARHHLDIDPRVEVGKLSPVQQSLLAIVRAFEELRRGGHLERHGSGLIVLDQPTPFLPAGDVSELFRLVRDLATAGASAIFVSHDIDEVMEITDRATVLRDGRVAGTVTTEAASKDHWALDGWHRHLRTGSFLRRRVGACRHSFAARPGSGGTPMTPAATRLMPQPLTAEAFADYGQLLEMPGQAGRQDFAARLVNNRASAKPNLALIHVEPTRLPLTIHTVENHPASSQAFVPLEGGRYLVVVSSRKRDGGPDLANARAFVGTKRQAFNYDVGTWHIGMTVLDCPTTFCMLIFEDGSPEDCHVLRLKHPLVIDATQT